MKTSNKMLALDRREKAANLELIRIQRERVKLASLFGGKGRASKLIHLDVESAGFWRASGNWQKPSRTSLVMHILFCLVNNETPKEFTKSKTFSRMLSLVVKRGIGTFVCFGASCQQIADEAGYKWDTRHNKTSPATAWGIAVQQVAQKGFLERVGWGEYRYTGKPFPCKGK